MNTITPNSYKIIIRDISEGRGEAFEVFVPAFYSYNFGDTIEKAIQSYYLYFESEKKRRKKEGIHMPVPDIFPQKMKQIPLRISEGIYEKIASKAEENGLSFNRFVQSLLENAAAYSR